MVIEGAIQGYQHVFVAAVVAYALDEAALRNFPAIEEPQIYVTTVFDVDALCSQYRRTEKYRDGRRDSTNRSHLFPSCRTKTYGRCPASLGSRCHGKLYVSRCPSRRTHARHIDSNQTFPNLPL
jgi:hypothetical protein